ATGVETIASEIRHIAELGLVGAEVPFTDPDKPIWDPYWEPLWVTAAAVGVPLHVHSNSPRRRVAPTITARAILISTLPLDLKDALAAVIFSGALERHPALKVVVAESGTGWVPYLLD